MFLTTLLKAIFEYHGSCDSCNNPGYLLYCNANYLDFVPKILFCVDFQCNLEVPDNILVSLAL